MHKCRGYGQDKLNSWPFFHLTFKCDLDRQPNWTNILNDTATPQEEHLYQTILKWMHKYRSYGQYKLNLWLFYIIWPSSATLTFNLPEQMFQMALLLLKENNYTKLF